jgi:hypothetical protein
MTLCATPSSEGANNNIERKKKEKEVKPSREKAKPT